MFNKLYLNLLFTFGILVIVSVLIVGFYIASYSYHFNMEIILEDLEDDAGFLNDDLTGKALLDGDKEYLKAIVKRAETGMLISIFDKQGKLLDKTDKGAPFDFKEHSVMPEVASALKGETTDSIRENPRGEDILYLAVPIKYEDKIVGALRISHELSSLEKKIAKLRKRILIGGAIAVSVTLLVGLYFAYSISRPISKISKVAELVSRGDFDQKVEVRNRDEIKKLADSFNNMTAQLKELDASRRDFIANTSHEVLTPLTSIRGFVETLLKGAVKKEKEAYEFLHIIEEQCEYLEHLIKDLLFLVKMEASDIKLSFEEISLAKIIPDAEKRFFPQIEKKKIELKVDVSSNLPLVKADAKLIRQMISNLLSNAVKHTPYGGTISLSARGEAGVVRISVKDSGEGILEEHLNNIFKRFYRIDKSRVKEGAGLGLAIVEHIVTAHHGKVYAESKLGQGSTFHVILPV